MQREQVSCIPTTRETRGPGAPIGARSLDEIVGQQVFAS